MTNSKHYCPIPFHHIAIRPNGTVQPCCAFRWNEIPSDFNLGYKNLFHEHPFMQKIRQDLREDKPVAGCSECYKAERLTGKSMRTEYIEEHRLGFSDEPPAEPELTYIDLALSNVCNNRCRMCNYELSTNWYSDSKKLGIEIPRGLIEHRNNFDDIDFSKLTYIKMIGGEPLMEQEKFIEILKKCNLPGMNILITTNATVRPNAELMELLSKCKKVRWNLSIDAYGPLNNFLRKGSRWENVESNLHWFAENFPKNINVNGVVSIYNINNFFELSDYVASHYSWCRTAFNIIDGSDWMHPRNLPEQVKATVIEKIKNHPHVTVNRAIDAIQQQGDFTEFLSMDKKLSDIRNEDWSDLNSELYELVKDYK
jgi:MoaA/NifB/PqqE/SkfB family radical SAM enzyme